MSKIYIVSGIVVAVVVIGGAIYYFASASNPSAMSDDKAAALILAYQKQNPPVGMMIAASDATCPFPVGGNGQSAAQSLVSEGYLIEQASVGYPTYAPTAKAAPYADTARSNAYDHYFFVAQAESVSVSDITSTGQNTDKVDFTETDELTPFGVVCSYPATKSDGTADLQLSNNGWSVVDAGA